MPHLDTDDTTAGWRTNRERLRKGLRRFDVYFLLLCSLVSLDTIGSIAAAGPEAFSWLLLLAVLFFVPYGLIVAELGAAYPFEGGPYTWTRLAFGRFLAGVTQLLYWLSNPVWVGGTLCILAMTTFETFFHPLPGAWSYLAGFAFIWAGILTTSVSVKIGKWVPAAGAIARMVLLGFFFASTVVYGVLNGIQPLHPASFTPTYPGFIQLVPVIAFTFVGFELSSSAAEEMHNPQRDVPLGVIRSGLTSFAMVAAPIAGVLAVLPARQISSLSGFIDACKAVFTIYGGHVNADGTVVLTGAGWYIGALCAVGLIVALFTSGVSWALGESRAQAVACADGAGPAWFGGISARFGTPVRINVLSGVLATLVLVAALNFTHGDAAKYFSAGLGLAISMTFFSYAAVFPALLVLRRKDPHRARPFRIPGGTAGAVACSGLATVIVAFVLVELILPGFGVGWFGTAGHADDLLPSGFGGQRGAYTLTQVVPLAVFVVTGVIFFLLGRRHIRAASSGQAAEAPPAQPEWTPK